MSHAACTVVLALKSAAGADWPDARSAVLVQNDATGSRCSLVERNGIESWRRTTDLDQMSKEALELVRFLDNGDDFHLGSVLGADKRVNFVDLR